MKDRTTGLVLGLAILTFAFLIGYKIYMGVSAGQPLNGVFIMILIAIAGIGLIRAGLFAGEKQVDMENFIMLVIMIAGPISLIYLLDKMGINLFSLVGATASFDIDFALRGTVVEFIKNNLIIVFTVLILLYIGRKKISQFWRDNIRR